MQELYFLYTIWYKACCLKGHAEKSLNLTLYRFVYSGLVSNISYIPGNNASVSTAWAEKGQVKSGGDLQQFSKLETAMIALLIRRGTCASFHFKKKLAQLCR